MTTSGPAFARRPGCLQLWHPCGAPGPQGPTISHLAPGFRSPARPWRQRIDFLLTQCSAPSHSQGNWGLLTRARVVYLGNLRALALGSKSHKLEASGETSFELRSSGGRLKLSVGGGGSGSGRCWNGHAPSHVASELSGRKGIITTVVGLPEPGACGLKHQ